MSNQPLVIVVLLNWQRAADTIACLESLREQDYPNLRVAVVDNGSQDGSPKAIAAACPEAELLALPANRGFAAGANYGMRWAYDQGAAFVFLINNDTTLAPDCLSRLVAAAHPEIGMLLPLVFYFSQPGRPWSVGGVCNPFTYEKDGDHPRSLAKAKAGLLDRDLVTGCALLIRRELFERVGWFDERFFMYYEDMDYSLRVRAAGYRIVLVTAAKMWHKVATSSGGLYSVNERYWMGRGSVLYFRKHARGWRIGVVIAYRTLSALKWLVRLVWRRRLDAAAAYLRGLRDGLRQAVE